MTGGEDVADPTHEHDEPIGDDVEWLVDDDGTEYFVDEDGTRWELGDDGYAYAVEPEATGDAAADETTELPAVTDTVAIRVEEPAPAPASAPATNGGPLLELTDVRSGYGKLPVLHGVGFGIRQGETAVLLGLNGAGKTTTALNVCGAIDTWGGTITFDGEDATHWSTRQAVNHGIVLVPEGRRVFPDLTVERNLQVGAWTQRKDAGWFENQRDRVFEYFPRLRERREQLAGTLSGGEQQMLAIGRGLLANPRLIIIDEASMGLAPVIVKDVFEIVSHINDDGVTVMMIEQNVGALDVADVGLVMEQGHIVRELRGDELGDRSLVSEILMG
jgi:branched-chain amino acid transport system ATP-binding protein